jgi:hypothetical protein
MEKLVERKKELLKSLSDYRIRLEAKRRLFYRMNKKQRGHIMAEIKQLMDSIENTSEAIFDINNFMLYRKEELG